MKIDFDSGRTTSKNVFYDGELESGIKFTINANWNEWDDWTVEDIMWDEQEGTEEEKEKITEIFKEHMNG